MLFWKAHSDFQKPKSRLRWFIMTKPCLYIQILLGTCALNQTSKCYSGRLIHDFQKYRNKHGWWFIVAMTSNALSFYSIPIGNLCSQPNIKMLFKFWLKLILTLLSKSKCYSGRLILTFKNLNILRWFYLPKLATLVFIFKSYLTLCSQPNIQNVILVGSFWLSKA